MYMTAIVQGTPRTVTVDSFVRCSGTAALGLTLRGADLRPYGYKKILACTALFVATKMMSRTTSSSWEFESLSAGTILQSGTSGL